MAEAMVVERHRAIERYRNGESVTAICRSLKRSREWFYKWQARAESGDPDWAAERSRRPVESPTQVSAPLAAQILTLRQSLAERGLFCGAQAIAWELAELGLRDLPSVRTIHRVLARAAACADVPRRAVSKGRPYPRCGPTGLACATKRISSARAIYGDRCGSTACTVSILRLGAAAWRRSWRAPAK